MDEVTNPGVVPTNKYTDDLQAIVDQLAHLFAEVDPSLDISLDHVAFNELKRLAGLQLTKLHSGQSIKRQIDSMIKGWRRQSKNGGGTAVQAAHYIDCLQQVRIAIFGEGLANEDGAYDLIVPDIDEEFKKFATVNQVDEDDLAAARKGFEAAWGDDQVLYLRTGVVSVNGELFKKMDDAEAKKYGFS